MEYGNGASNEANNMLHNFWPRITNDIENTVIRIQFILKSFLNHVMSFLIFEDFLKN